MYTTTEIFREMLEIGMIDKKEYAEMVCEYRNHVKALMEMDLMAKKAKETIDRINTDKENQQGETDPRFEKLCDAYLNGHIPEEDFKRLSKSISKDVKYMTGILK